MKLQICKRKVFFHHIVVDNSCWNQVLLELSSPTDAITDVKRDSMKRKKNKGSVTNIQMNAVKKFSRCNFFRWKMSSRCHFYNHLEKRLKRRFLINFVLVIMRNFSLLSVTRCEFSTCSPKIRSSFTLLLSIIVYAI